MDMLRVKGNQIVDQQNHPFKLRGTCVGGWMNMEEFINGYPGAEHQLRATMAARLGAAKTDFFFERMMDYFFAEEDAAYLVDLGATVVRLPLNYRHFEDDARPFEYLEKGFIRLDRAIDFCARHELYVIIDLHAVQGWQNTDWHSDNASRHTFFWQHPHFQDRFYGLWEQFARRYRGNPAVAGYNVMNEPVTGAPYGRFRSYYKSNWDAINRVYAAVVEKIRAIDPEHIIFLEGDFFSSRFEGLDAPFAPNLVYSSHNYTTYGLGPGTYPDIKEDQEWNFAGQWAHYLSQEGTRFARKHNVPLWVGEFGAVYNGPATEVPDRLRAMDDQLAILNMEADHWTTWTYKDLNVMGLVQQHPDSPYMRAIRPVLDAKAELQTDFWMSWVEHTQSRQIVDCFADQVEKILQDKNLDPQSNRTFMSQALLSGYVAGLMQPLYVECFAEMSNSQIDEALASFAFKNCRPHQALVDIFGQRVKD